MDRNRGILIVGASLAALAAGWYIRRWYVQRGHEDELESSEKVKDFDATMKSMNAGKKRPAVKSGNGRAKATSS